MSEARDVIGEWSHLAGQPDDGSGWRVDPERVPDSEFFAYVKFGPKVDPEAMRRLIPNPLDDDA